MRKEIVIQTAKRIVDPTKQSRTEGALKEKEQVVKAQVEKVESCDS